VLSVSEVERVLAQPDLSTALGRRDRAIVEVLYSTGIRRMELVGLDCTDLDAERGTLFVREGKGKKDRLVPIGERAVRWTLRYCDRVRPQVIEARGAPIDTPSEHERTLSECAWDAIARDEAHRSPASVSGEGGHREARQRAHFPPHHGDADARRRR
jgi:site-specific recombinase XerD